MSPINIKKIIYPALLMIFIVGAIAPTVFSINFFIKEIDSSFVTDEAKIMSQLITLNLRDFKFIAPKAGVDFDSLGL